MGERRPSILGGFMSGVPGAPPEWSHWRMTFRPTGNQITFDYVHEPNTMTEAERDEQYALLARLAEISPVVIPEWP